jgi:hypothetical protein
MLSTTRNHAAPLDCSPYALCLTRPRRPCAGTTTKPSRHRGLPARRPYRSHGRMARSLPRRARPKLPLQPCPVLPTPRRPAPSHHTPRALPLREQNPNTRDQRCHSLAQEHHPDAAPRRAHSLQGQTHTGCCTHTLVALDIHGRTLSHHRRWYRRSRTLWAWRTQHSPWPPRRISLTTLRPVSPT